MVNITPDIYWAGYIDWDLRNFHGYSTPSGSTYNAYLIKDEKPVLIDTVKHYGYAEMLRRIKEVIAPEKIAYIISNHTEMDHSGTIEELLKICPNAQVVCSPKGAEGLTRHFKKNWKLKVVNSGDKLNIGRRDLQFLLMPMVHWPDSMATYSPADNILFPNDAFGQHYASAERYVDEVGLDIAVSEARKYYANIVLPYGSQVLKVLEAVKALKINMICPSHGLIWRKKEHIDVIADLYRRWASYDSENRAVIIYDTMWNSTRAMALKLFEYLEQENIPVSLVDLKTSDYSAAITEVMRSKAVLVGSSILNMNILPSVGGFLIYLKGLKPKNRFAFTFGSYGWAESGFKGLEDPLKEAGMESLGPGRYVKYIPDPAELESLQLIAKHIKQKFSAT